MKVTIGDRIWIACALLHRQHPDRTSFVRSEIIGKLEEIDLTPENLGSLRTHLSSHCIADKKPDPDSKRTLTRDGSGLRLYRPGDPIHPGRRSGKTAPDAEGIPPEHRPLLDWYRNEYCGGLSTSEIDPVLALRGVGKQVWRELGGGDEFIRRIRKDWFGPREAQAISSKRDLAPAGNRK